jgi:hypothetical protein
MSYVIFLYELLIDPIIDRSQYASDLVENLPGALQSQLRLIRETHPRAHGADGSLQKHRELHGAAAQQQRHFAAAAWFPVWVTRSAPRALGKTIQLVRRIVGRGNQREFCEGPWPEKLTACV